MTIIKCKLCKKSKEESNYKLFRGKLNKSCNECRVKNNLWYSQDINGKRTKAKERYQKIKDKIAQYRSDLRLDRKYSLDRKTWNSMLEKQDNKCAVCNIDFKNLKPCVDHDHITMKVRGLLCRRCNLELQVIENQQFVKKAQKYLKSMK